MRTSMLSNSGRLPLPNPLPQGDSDFLRAEAREKSYVPQAGEGANAMPKPIDDRFGSMAEEEWQE
jgi:hypothetical protein